MMEDGGLLMGLCRWSQSVSIEAKLDINLRAMAIRLMRLLDR